MYSETIRDFYPTRKFDKPFIVDRKDPVVYENNLGINILNNDEVNFFEKNGYLFFPHFFTNNDVTAFSSELKRLVTDENKKHGEIFT